MNAEMVRVGVDAILRDRLRIGVPDPLTDLLETGLVDSLALVELIAAIEQRFDVVINLMDLDLDQVRTVPAIYDLVQQVVLAKRPTTPSLDFAAIAGTPPVSAPVTASEQVA